CRKCGRDDQGCYVSGAATTSRSVSLIRRRSSDGSICRTSVRDRKPPPGLSRSSCARGHVARGQTSASRSESMNSLDKRGPESSARAFPAARRRESTPEHAKRRAGSLCKCPKHARRRVLSAVGSCVGG